MGERGNGTASGHATGPEPGAGPVLPAPAKGERKRTRKRRIPPLGMSLQEAADSLGVSQNTFQRLVDDGKIPGPTQLYGRKVYSWQHVSQAFWALFPHLDTKDQDDDPWGEQTV